MSQFFLNVPPPPYHGIRTVRTVCMYIELYKESTVQTPKLGSHIVHCLLFLKNSMNC